VETPRFGTGLFVGGKVHLGHGYSLEQFGLSQADVARAIHGSAE
jgi:hypothetical protein